MVLLIFLVALMYFRTTRILKNADKMIDDAINDIFFESDFSETRLSKLEAKMRRYLMGAKSRGINLQKNITP